MNQFHIINVWKLISQFIANVLNESLRAMKGLCLRSEMSFWLFNVLYGLDKKNEVDGVAKLSYPLSVDISIFSNL